MDQNIVLARLANFGIRGIVYNWFKDYLYDRKQYVCISGTNSECGNTSIKLFADDTNLFIFNNIVEDLQVDAMDKILLLNNWFVANKLSLSPDKTCYLVRPMLTK